MIKSTPLESRHIALGARMTEFAGYNMPILYTNLQEEHHAVRNAVGVFDVSHMGEFIVKGKDALALVQRISSNDASTLEYGQAQYSCLPNEVGGIVDDMLVYRLWDDMAEAGEQTFMLVVNASNIEKDWNWIRKFNNEKDWDHIQRYAVEYDVRMINISDQTGLIAVQGPQATACLQSLTDVKLSDIPYYHFVKGTVAGIDNVLISATGYTGAGGFELYVANEHLPALWDTVLNIQHPVKPVPAGLGARDTLRLEMGYCLYGNDIDDTTSVLEAGLGWITKLKKNSDFPSKTYFEEQKKEGLEKKLVGFVVDDRRVPRHGYPVCDEAGNDIGVVTSGTLSPTLQIPIGMAYVPVSHSKAGATFGVKAGSKILAARVVPLPFVKSTT